MRECELQKLSQVQIWLPLELVCCTEWVKVSLRAWHIGVGNKLHSDLLQKPMLVYLQQQWAAKHNTNNDTCKLTKGRPKALKRSA